MRTAEITLRKFTRHHTIDCTSTFLCLPLSPSPLRKLVDEPQARECGPEGEVTGTCNYMAGPDRWSKQPTGLVRVAFEAETY
jgi:hypothetical protein